MGGSRILHWEAPPPRLLSGCPSHLPAPPRMLPLVPCYIILPLLFPFHTHVPGPCRAVSSHASPPYHAPARPLRPPGSLSRVILLPLQAHVGLFAPMLLPPLTSTLMSPLPGSQEIDYQLQNRFSIPEPILNSKTDSKLWKPI